MATGRQELDWIGELLDGFLQAEIRMLGHHLFHYESMVAGNFEELGKALGFPVSGVDNVPRCHAHVPRTRASGDWRNWFLQEDLNALLPLLRPYLTHYGYDPDLKPATRPEILPEHASGYLQRILKDRQAT
jgi:hypothetical protein